MKKAFWLINILCLVIPALGSAKEWDPRLQQAMELSFSGRPEQAETLMESYRREFSQDPNGLFFLAIVREWKAGLGPANHHQVHIENRKLLQQALHLSEQRRQARPEDVDAWIDLGNSYFFLARNFAEQGAALKAGMTGKKLEKPMKEALARDPSRYEAYLALGAFHYFAGNTPKVWVPFKKLLGIHGNKEEGLKELRESLRGNHPFLWQARYALLEIFSSAEEDYDQALAQLAPFEASFPQNPVLPLKKAFLFEKRDPAEAIKIYLDFAEQCGRKFLPCPKKFLYFAYSQAGRLSLNEGRFAQAFPLLQKSLEFDPEDYPKRTAQIKKWQKAAKKGMGSRI